MALCAQRAGAVASSARARFKFAEACEFCNSTVIHYSSRAAVLSLVIFNAFKYASRQSTGASNLFNNQRLRLFSLWLSHMHAGSLAQQLPLVFVPAHFPPIAPLICIYICAFNRLRTLRRTLNNLEYTWAFDWLVRLLYNTLRIICITVVVFGYYLSCLLSLIHNWLFRIFGANLINRCI